MVSCVRRQPVQRHPLHPRRILGFFGLFIIFVDSVSYGAGLLVIAFLISPYGLPMLATWLLAKLHVLRYAIHDRIYG